MKRRLLYAFTASLYLMACNNESPVNNTSNTDTTTSAHQGHNSTATTEAGQQKSMMQIMMQMDNSMNNTQLTGDADRDFAQMMKVHHQSAVEMAQLEIAQGANQEVKSLAQRMISEQQKEIAAFDQFLQSGKKGTTSPDYQKELKASLKGMDHSQHGNGTIDEQFLMMMIPHHQGAIDMATPYLKYAKDPTLKTLAQNIITSQQAEITEMKELQKGKHQH